MTTHDTDITTLIANIRAWQAAAAEYEDACNEPMVDNGSNYYQTTPRRRAAIKTLDECAMNVIGDVHNEVALAAYVALADEIERLNHECLTLATTGYSSDVFQQSLKEVADNLIGADEQSSD